MKGVFDKMLFIQIFHADVNPDNADYVYNALVCIKDLHQEEPIE